MRLVGPTLHFEAVSGQGRLPVVGNRRSPQLSFSLIEVTLGTCSELLFNRLPMHDFPRNGDVSFG